MRESNSAFTASAALALLVGLPAAAAPASSIATVKQAQGDVGVVEAATRTPRPLAASPDTGRIPNDAIQNGDEIRTGANGSATIACRDGSLFRVEGGTRLSLSEAPIAGGPAAGRKSVKRNLRLQEGRLEGEIKPSASVYTSLRTPAVVAGIRQGKLSAVVSGIRCQMGIRGGSALLMDIPGRAVVNLDDGDRVLMETTDAGDLLIQAVEAAEAGIAVKVGETKFRMPTESILRVSGAAATSIVVTGVSGDIWIVNAATGAATPLPPGKSHVAVGETTETVPAAGSKAPAPSRPSDYYTVPHLPAVPWVQETVESSPFK
jgi:hypothetical protein